MTIKKAGNERKTEIYKGRRQNKIIAFKYSLIFVEKCGILY